MEVLFFVDDGRLPIFRPYYLFEYCRLCQPSVLFFLAWNVWSEIYFSWFSLGWNVWLAEAYVNIIMENAACFCF